MPIHKNYNIIRGIQNYTMGAHLMDSNISLSQIRSEIDKIDEQIMSLLATRQKAILKVAEYKKDHNLPIFSPDRENEIFNRVEQHINEESSNGFKLLYGILMDLYKFHEYKAVPDSIRVPTNVGGASVRAVIDDTPFALCRYLSPLAIANVSIINIRSQFMPGGRLLVDLELSGDVSDPSFAAVLSVLSDAAEKFTLL